MNYTLAGCLSSLRENYSSEQKLSQIFCNANPGKEVSGKKEAFSPKNKKALKPGLTGSISETI